MYKFIFWKYNVYVYICITHNIVYAIINGVIPHKKKIIINQECRITFIRLNLYVKYIQTSEIVSNLLKQNIYHIAQLSLYVIHNYIARKVYLNYEIIEFIFV